MALTEFWKEWLTVGEEQQRHKNAREILKEGEQVRGCDIHESFKIARDEWLVVGSYHGFPQKKLLYF